MCSGPWRATTHRVLRHSIGHSVTNHHSHLILMALTDDASVGVQVPRKPPPVTAPARSPPVMNTLDIGSASFVLRAKPRKLSASPDTVEESGPHDAQEEAGSVGSSTVSVIVPVVKNIGTSEASSVVPEHDALALFTVWICSMWMPTASPGPKSCPPAPFD